MNKELDSSRIDPEKEKRRFRIHCEARYGAYCQSFEQDIGAIDQQEALRKFFEEHLHFYSDVFTQAIEQLEVTQTSGKIRVEVNLPRDDTGDLNDRVLDLVVMTALSARFIAPPSGPAPVIRWWEDEFLMSFEQIEDVTARQVCPTCDGSGEVLTQRP